MPLISFSGLPGIGKTTIARLLAAKMECRVFLEPEEDQWPEAVQHRYPGSEDVTFFWFRSVRGNNLYLADRVRREHEWAIVDTMYEHIRKAYLAHHAISRLTERHKFQDIIEMICHRDWDSLPSPDLCFFLRTDEQTWVQRLRSRSRISDRVLKIENQYSLQEEMEKATIDYCKQRDIFCRSLANDTDTQHLVVEQALDSIANWHTTRVSLA